MASFDTLSAAHELEAAGADRTLAEAIARTVRDGQGELATKSDVRALKSDVRTLQWVAGVQSAITLATFAIVAAKLP